MTNMKQGNLVELPGLPAFYDYEWYPQPVDVRETPRYNELVFIGMVFFSATTNYHQASMTSLRLEQSKFTQFLVEFDDGPG